jgi:hypothetical protein
LKFTWFRGKARQIAMLSAGIAEQENKRAKALWRYPSR